MTAFQWAVRNAARAAVAMALPFIIVDIVCEDNVLASMVTGGEWLRLNASSTSSQVCFGRTTKDDRRCRFTSRTACLAVAGEKCLWASPFEARCSGEDEACAEFGTSQWRCPSASGCTFARPLDNRLECRQRDRSSPFGGERCDAFHANASDAMSLLRDELRWILCQLFSFIFVNALLLEAYGAIDAVPKPLVLLTFLAVAGAGHVRRSYVEHGDLSGLMR